MRISVIVTVFDVCAAHLETCLNSILLQTLREADFEIVVVDDCSTDLDTINTLELFNSAHSQIKVIRHEENVGPNKARQTGVEEANADFVVFVDGDDALTSDAIESLLIQAKRDGADVVVANFFRWNDRTSSYEKWMLQGKPFPQDFQGRIEMLVSARSSFSLCGRLFRRSLLSDYVFSMPDHTLHEDVICFSRIMFEARKVSAIQRHIYYYRLNPDSITSRFTDAHVKGVVLAFKEWVDQVKKHNLWGDLSSAVRTGSETLINTAVVRIAYTAGHNPNEAFRVLELLWRGVNGKPFLEVDRPSRPGLKLLLSLFGEKNTAHKQRMSELIDEFQLMRRPALYDETAVLAEGLGPSEMARRLKDKIVFVCQVNYHVSSAAIFARELRRRGVPCVVLDNSHYVVAGARKSTRKELDLLWRTEYIAVPKPPYEADWLATARLVITFNDFNDETRGALEFRRLMGQRSVCLIEGINDFLRVDFSEPRYLPYRRCDTVFLAGKDDEKYFEDRETYVVGLPNIEQLREKNPKFPDQPLAVLNVNFTYGALEDRREEFVVTARNAFESAGIDWVITQHPMDKASLDGFPISEETQYELIDRGTVFVSRFATGILEALASGKPAIYFNPHGERVAKFKDTMGAFHVANTARELTDAIKDVISDVCAGVDFRTRALAFLEHHTGFSDRGLTSVERLAVAVSHVIDPNDNSRAHLAELFFDRLDAQDQCIDNAPGLIFGNLDRRHYAQLDESELIVRYFGRRKGIMFDVGANVGNSADKFLGQGWTVHAFEPDPSNREGLGNLGENFSELIINEQAVSDQVGLKVPFFASDESTGISSLSAFTSDHKKICEVETTTLAVYFSEAKLLHVDFLKIDVEGHDKFVLDGFPWEKDRPDVILVEFEDNKTLGNGYNTHDLADTLLSKGYAVYVSEWLPIERYGLAHDWRRLIRYSENLELRENWGNLIGFLHEPDEIVLRSLVQETVKFAKSPPHRQLSSADARVDDSQTKAFTNQANAVLANELTFRQTNERFRLGDFDVAMQNYLRLYSKNPLLIYETNAVWAARKLQMKNVQNTADFQIGDDGQWRLIDDLS
jgi:FkbM family methyltransferase